MSTREETGPEMDMDQGVDPDATARSDDGATPSLLPEDELDEFRSRWDSTQARFVDDPRQAVTEADSLVQELLGKLTDSFTNERQTLEEKWGGDSSEASTEDLRVALQRYRSLFGRLLAA